MHEIPGGDDPVGLFGVFPGVDEHQDRSRQVENALVKEEGVMPFAARNAAVAAEDLFKGQNDALQAASAVPFVDIDGKGEELQGLVGHLRAVHFLVGEIPPPADRLREQHADENAVRGAEDVDFFDIADEKDACRPAENAADDGQPARADAVFGIRKGEPIAELHAAGDAVKQPRGDERHGQGDDEIGEEEIFRHISAAEEQRDDEKRRHHAADDDDCIGVDFESEDGYARILVRRKRVEHEKLLFSVPFPILYHNEKKSSRPQPDDFSESLRRTFIAEYPPGHGFRAGALYPPSARLCQKNLKLCSDMKSFRKKT